MKTECPRSKINKESCPQEARCGYLDVELRVALAGSPNVGKTSLFNRLTGLSHHVANYPGVTVDRKVGRGCHLCQSWEVTDLPGTYSLAASSPDERVVVESLMGHIEDIHAPDVIVAVADGTNLHQSLFLPLQLAELGRPMVLAINLMDAARDRGIKVDAAALEKELGVPVVLISAARNQGISDLVAAVCLAAREKRIMRPMPWPSFLHEAVEGLKRGIASAGGRDVETPAALRMLLDARSALRDLSGLEADPMASLIEEERQKIFRAGHNPLSLEAVLRYEYLGQLLRGRVLHLANASTDWSQRIDAVLMHRVAGLLIFLGLMWTVFQAVYSWAGPLMDGISSGTDWAGENLERWTEGSPVLQSLLVDGVVAGVGGVIVFLPQIFILFGFVSLLESTGYMARAAFLMDKLFSWSGLNGKSFVPMLSGYACAIPGVMATRTIEDPKARLTTLLITPLMSCSARLPVYVLFIGAFVEPAYGAGVAGATLFAMHLLGLLVAGPVAWCLHRFVLKIGYQPFILEMPPYRRPVLGEVFRRAAGGALEFLQRAGTVIFALSILIWAALYFPRPEAVQEKARATFVLKVSQEQNITPQEAQKRIQTEPTLASAQENAVEVALVRQSYLGEIGHRLEPLFMPAGFDWRVSIALLASFPAREVIISSLGILFQIGGDVDEDSESLREMLSKATWDSGPRAGQPLFTVPMALALMVFFALCMQCMATLAIMAKESSWCWALFGFAYMTILAWIGAVVTYQIGSILL
jgi:ferrous iron transport protein B